MKGLRRTQLFHYITFGVLILGCAVIGIKLLSESHAASPSISAEPENGTVTAPASSIADASASNGHAAKFGPDVPSGAMNIYYGSTHDHTGHFNNHGSDDSTPAQVFAAAKAHHFDFLFLTEHSGKTGPISTGTDPQVFYADVKAQAAHYTDSTFVGIPGYEFSDNDGGTYNGMTIGKGHMTAINTDTFVSADGATNTAASLEDYLVSQAAAGKPAYGGFNHPGPTGHPGSVPALLTPARRKVIVMNEVMNSYLSPSDISHYQSWIAALDRGWRVAPTCGLDGHGLFRVSDESDSGGPCRVGILAPSLSVANINAAFMARRIFATRDTNLQVSYKANGQWMGSQIGTPANVSFDISVSDPDTTKANNKITKIDIITGGGAVAASKTFSTYNASWQVTIPSNNKKYFALRIFNGEQTNYIAAAAPVWLEAPGT